MTDTALHAVPAQTLVIIGGGYSGTLTAVHLLREGRGRPLELVLVEQRARPGRGLAYHIWDDSMLLNVPAGNMSAFAEQPAHFLDYCRGIDPAFNAGSFVPRSWTSSIASIAPSPRTSPTCGHRDCHSSMRARIVSPTSPARSTSRSSSKTSSTAEAAASATGLPMKVPPIAPACGWSMSAALPTTPESEAGMRMEPA